MIEHYIEQTGRAQPPVRGGETEVELDAAARQSTAHLAVSRLAGHNRGRASAAYLGAVLHKKNGGPKGGAAGGAAAGDPAA